MNNNKNNRLQKATKIILPLAIIVLGAVCARYLYASKQNVKKMRPRQAAPLVNIIPARKGEYQIFISAMGTVRPSCEIALKPQVSGKVKEISSSFVPGGVFKKGETILRLDPEDFELALKRQEAMVTRARANLKLETGQQEVAREDLKIMQAASGRVIQNTDLALRKPQMAQARADLEVALADRDQAQLNLKRSLIRAPFNCMVTTRNVNTGSQVSTQETLATLVGTDTYWVEATVPMNRLDKINIPARQGDKGSPAKVMTSGESEYAGEVIRLMGDINSQSRMARILVRIGDPLGLASKNRKPPLLLSSYVTVHIKGKTIGNVIPIPITALKNGKEVWLAENKKLSIRKVKPIWKADDLIYVENGITSGESIIISELAAPVDGMAIRVNGAKPLSLTNREETGKSNE